MTFCRISGLWGATCATILAAVAGCGSRDPDAIPAVPAAGTVTYQGKPVEEGSVRFVPEKGRPAGGAIKGGHFTLSTYDPDDGAIPGKHHVGVTATKKVPVPGGGEPRDVYVIPEKYADPSGSGIEIDVPKDGSKDLKIEIQ